MSYEPLLSQYVPLKTVVAYYLDETDKSQGDEDKCWILGLRGLVELHQDISAEPITVRLPVNKNKTVTYPPGCISWTKVGLLNSHGEVVTLKINNGLTKYRDSNPNRLQSLTPNINDSIGALGSTPLYLNYYYNDGYYNLFGVGNGLIQYGECTMDDANRVVVLPENFKYKDIIFEYISSPERDTDYKIPLALQEAVIAFISWKNKTGTRQDFIAAATNGRRRLRGKKVTLQGINQVIRESQGMKLRS